MDFIFKNVCHTFAQGMVCYLYGLFVGLSNVIGCILSN